MKRVAASVFLIFFGFALTACGRESDEPVLTGAFAETEEQPTGDGPVDNSHSGGAEGDGRMLKPEGHKGMWFETEPTDPWEHYVWASQKFVGDPIELPKLEGKGPDDPLAGLPDVCNEKVIERMKEVGFEHRTPFIINGFNRCGFSDVDFNEYSTGNTLISFTYDANVDKKILALQDKELNPSGDPLLVEWAGASELDCRYGVKRGGELIGYTTFHPVDSAYSGPYQCRAVKLVWQMFENLT